MSNHLYTDGKIPVLLLGLKQANQKKKVTIGKISKKKIRAKGGSCIGLYMCLFETEHHVTVSAKKLCNEKLHIILIGGNKWEDLAQEKLPFDQFIDYMISKVRTGHSPVPPKIIEIQEWLSEKETVSKNIKELLRSKSAIFLRRHKNPRHESLYVSRYIDQRVQEFARSLRPSRLLTKSRITHHDDNIKIVERTPPEQICIIRDLSGSGKTTLAINLTLKSLGFFALSQSAIESDLDEIDEVLKTIKSFKSDEYYGLPDTLYAKIRKILLKCAPLSTDQEVNNLFIEERLVPWRNKLPQAKNPTERAEALIAFLVNQTNSENINGLVAFLAVLKDRVSEKDKCFYELENIVQDTKNYIQSKDKISTTSNSYGFGSLLKVDKPIIFIVDSLDEANTIPNKKAEILSLIRFVKQLNNIAYENNLLAFPAGLIFTVREDYWRKWEAIFEGQNSITISKRISTFSGPEFQEAIKKYSTAYEYKVSNPIKRDVKEILSTPFNLQIFSEANEYQGFVSTLNLGSNVLNLFFTRKGESILRQRIPGFYFETLMGLCSDIALHMTYQGLNKISRAELLQIIDKKHIAIGSNAEQVIVLLESEQILNKTNNEDYRLRHTQILEYLVSYAIVRKIDHKGTVETFDEMITAVVDSNIASIFSVHEYIRDITYTQFKHLSKKIDKYYSDSNIYMSKVTTTIRDKIASGIEISKGDINLILKNTDTKNPETTWNSFFILAAKNNHQTNDKLLQAYKIAWALNSERIDRWKLIDKLSERKLLLSEMVFHSVLESNSWKDWQVYLGCIVETMPSKSFQEFINEIGKETILECIEDAEDDEWKYVAHLMQILLEGKSYTPGERL